MRQLSKNYCSEGGFALVNIIVAIIIFSILGAALVKILSSSAFSQVGSNSSMRAYYLAEGGYRYAGSQFLHAGAPPTESTRDNMLLTLHNTTYTMANNIDKFQLDSFPWFYKTVSGSTTTSLITVIKGAIPAALATMPSPGRLWIGSAAYSYTGYTVGVFTPTIGTPVTFTVNLLPASVPGDDVTVLPVASPASAQTLSNGGQLTLASGDFFPLYGGTFKLSGSNTVYTYKNKNSAGNILQNIRDFNDPATPFTSVSVTTLTDVTLLKYLELHSTGTVGSGIMLTNRMVNYRGPISSTATDQGGGGQPEQILDLAAIAAASGATSTGQFGIVSLGGDTALKVTQTTSGSGQGNQPSTEAYVTLPSGTSNPLYQSWNAAGNYLSYDVQVKIATGDWSTDHFINKPDTYSAGVLFRATPLSNQSTYYGLSYMRSFIDPNSSTTDGIADTLTPPPSGSYTVWSSGNNYAVGDIVSYSGVYYRCIAVHTSNNPNRPPSANWDPYKRAMIVLWTRNGNAGNGDDNWLAYKTLDEGGADFVLDSSAHIKDWSTIMARVVEAASIKLAVSDAPLVSVGDTIIGGNGTATAKVYKKINDIDGNVVLLLNNVVGTFTRPATVGSYNTDAGWGYRLRDNYIWAFYSDTGDHGSNTTAVDNTRLGEPRGTITWPNTDIPNWDADGDKFTLVQWGSNLNTSQDSTLRIMGSGKEAGAIIRTSKWTTGSYTLDSFPPEIGLVSVGSTSTQTYFDDFAYYLRGAADGGTPSAIGFLPPIQQ